MFASIDPFTRKLIGETASHQAWEVEGMLLEAHQAQKDWSASGLQARLRCVQSLSHLLRTQKRELAVLMSCEMGKLLAEGEAEIEKCAYLCEYYADTAAKWLADEDRPSDASFSKLIYQPLGTILGIMPWNYPFWQAFRFIIPTLIAGNAVVLKHASNVSLSAKAIADLFRRAGLPTAVFRVFFLTGSDAAKLINHPFIQGVSLTGSEAVGRSVGAAAGNALKPAVLELGGSDPFLVFEDADLDLAVEQAFVSRFQNAGQSCIAAKRMIIHKSIIEPFTEKLLSKVDALRCGNPREASTTIAPLARAEFVIELQDQVKCTLQQGARLLRGGGPWKSHEGFMLPTVLDQVLPNMLAAQEELFGPVAVIMKFGKVDEAFALANDTRFGLGAAVFTFNETLMRRATNEIAAGAVFINGMVKSHPGLAFGGIKASGFGRELSAEGLRAFTNFKTCWKNQP
ncbi:MAG: aldehyde dehydrogenase family protein [Bacteroidia bacterium]